MKIHPGHGKKVCKKCQQICAAAKKVCPNPDCNADFESKEKPKEESKKDKIMRIPQIYSDFNIRSTTYTPAGEPPISLPKVIDEESVENWMHETRKYFLKKNNSYLMNAALCYYVRFGYDIKEKDHKKICDMINQKEDIEFVNKEKLDVDNNQPG